VTCHETTLLKMPTRKNVFANANSSETINCESIIEDNLKLDNFPFKKGSIESNRRIELNQNEHQTIPDKKQIIKTEEFQI